ncbi:MAG: nuclear transport factor 2 family protein [Acidobacteriota bacterium]|nr:nuclear transport factor 2 family protein [Acidobacteriota bacterium]
MSKLISVLALTMVISPALDSQDPYNPDGNPPNPEMQRQEIVTLERETARAILLNNATFFRRVYADDFAGTLSHGQTVDKTHLIIEVESSGASYQSFNASDIQVRIFRETAVATCLWTSRGFFRGQAMETQMRVMHVYINGPRGWHVVAAQTTPLPPYTAHPL